MPFIFAKVPRRTFSLTVSSTNFLFQKVLVRSYNAANVCDNHLLSLKELKSTSVNEWPNDGGTQSKQVSH